MNKQPDLNAIMADYTQQVIAENRRRQAIREAVANGTYQEPAGTYGTWDISDRD